VTAVLRASWIDTGRLRRAHPVAAVAAGRYGIALRPVGRALVGRCPLHADGAHPNLHVYPAPDPAGDGWYCYRCGVGGDVIEFVALAEGLDFRAACARLGGLPAGAPPPAGTAAGAAPALPVGRSAPLRPLERPERRWDRLTLEEQIVLNTACAVYQHALWREPRALAYVRDRGLPDWVTRACALGYADGHSLEAYLRRRSGLRTAQALGLLRAARRGDGGPVAERLAGRIVVPELRGGQCLWLIGRALEEGDGGGGGGGAGPKYLALPGERPVLGYERAAGRREAFLCEGVFDYLTAVGWGLPAFSPCGTALPADRLGFLAGARAVYGVLDGDEAGRAAAARFAAQLGPRFRALRLPDGCDLNDLACRPDGRATFFRLLAAARPPRAPLAPGAAGPPVGPPLPPGSPGPSGPAVRPAGAPARPARPDAGRSPRAAG
jgi:DNA primase